MMSPLTCEKSLNLLNLKLNLLLPIVQRPVIYEGVPFDPEKLKKVEEAIEFFEKMLEVRGGPFAAGSTITLADAALIASISSIDVRIFTSLESTF